jgi:hypothetical protein
VQENFFRDAKRLLAAMVMALIVSGPPARPAAAADSRASPSAGQESRPIKSLSDDDLAELERGGGWGLARAAELNGIPGPAHLLELASVLPLSAEQAERIDSIFQDMRSRAITVGERLIAEERALDAAFHSASIDKDGLRERVARIATIRGELRYIHLAAHLDTLPLLTGAQIARYRELRGYGGDMCENIPAGHDATAWLRHHGCD